MSTQITVEEAKKQLRQARLAQHKSDIEKYLRTHNDTELANACSGFVALFRSKSKAKAKTTKSA